MTNDQSPNLDFNFNATPKGHIASYVFGYIFRGGIVPSRIFVDLAIHYNVVVASNTFPGTGGVGVAGLKIVLVEGIRGKVLVPFDDFTPIALG